MRFFHQTNPLTLSFLCLSFRYFQDCLLYRWVSWTLCGANDASAASLSLTQFVAAQVTIKGSLIRKRWGVLVQTSIHDIGDSLTKRSYLMKHYLFMIFGAFSHIVVSIWQRENENCISTIFVRNALKAFLRSVWPWCTDTDLPRLSDSLPVCRCSVVCLQQHYVLWIRPKMHLTFLIFFHPGLWFHNSGSAAYRQSLSVIM